MNRTILIALTVLLSFAISSFALTVEQQRDSTLGTVVYVENSFFSMKIAADSGGRICSFVPKSDNIERVWWKGDGRSGLLDDKGALTAVPYELMIKNPDDKTAAISLRSPEDSGRVFTKVLTIGEDDPAIRLTYRIKNTRREERTISHMIRSYWLAGGEAGAEDHYFWRDDYGVQSKPYPYGGVGVWHRELGGSWYAVVDSKAETGLALWVEPEHLTFYYNWADNTPSPTVEFNIAPVVQPNEQVDIDAVIAFFRGLKTVSDVTPDNVFAVSTTSEETTLMTKLHAHPLRPWVKTPGAVWMRYETLDRIFLWAEATSAAESIPVGKVTELLADYTAPVEGTYVMQMGTRDCQDKEYTFELPVDLGRPSGVYYRGKRKASTARTMTTISDQDIQCGYAMFWPRHAPPFEPITARELTLGNDERESLEIGLLGLTDMGTITLTCQSNPAIPDDAIQIRHAGAAYSLPGPPRTWGSWALLPGNELILNKGDGASFWVTLDSSKLEPGKCSLSLLFTDAKKQTRNVAVLVDVRPVRTMNRDDYSMVLYHTYNNIVRGGGFEKHLELMYDAGVRQLMLYFNSPIWMNTIEPRMVDGEVQADFTRFNEWLKPARDLGYHTIGLMYNIAHPKWLADIPGFENEKRRWQIEQQFAHLLAENILQQGFKEMWFYGIEEPSISFAMSPKLLAELKRVRKYHPEMKIHATANHYSRAMVDHLDPYVDIWTCTRPIAQTLQADARAGRVKLSAGDRISFYSSAFFNAMPGRLRGLGWIGARGGFKHYTGFAYHQGMRPTRQWVCFAEDSDGKPVGTAALEALREGFEDYLYLHALTYHIRQVRKGPLTSGAVQAVGEAEELLARIYSGKEPRCNFSERPGSHGADTWMALQDPDYLDLAELHGEIIRIIDKLLRSK